MRLFSLNINGLEGKEEELGIFINDENPDIIFLQETKTRSSEFHQRPDYPGYSEHYNERGDNMKKGGGLGMIWRENLNVIIWDMIPPKEKEYLDHERQWYTLVSGQTKYALLNVYMAFEIEYHREWNEDLISLIHQEMQIMVQDGYELILAGDLNAKIGNNFQGALSKNIPQVDTNGRHILNLAKTFNLQIANDMEKEETLITRRCIDRSGKVWSSSTIDYFLTSSGVNVTDFKILSGNTGTTSSDHLMIELQIRIDREIFTSKQRRIKPLYDLRKMNQETDKIYAEKSYEYLHRTPIKHFKKMQQKEQIKILEKSMIKAASYAYPPKKKQSVRRINVSMKARMNLERRQHLWEKMRKGMATNEEVKEFRTLKRKMRETYKLEQQVRRTKTAVKLAINDPTSEHFWSIYRSRKDKEPGIQALKGENGQIETLPEKMCEVAYKAFKKRLNGHENPQEQYRGTYDNCLFKEQILRPVGYIELSKTISSFKNGKAGGPHNLKPELVKNLSRKGLEYLLAWINNVFRNECMDQYLNEGVIKLIYKRRSKLDPLSYRPITLTCVLGRIIAR